MYNYLKSIKKGGIVQYKNNYTYMTVFSIIPVRLKASHFNETHLLPERGGTSGDGNVSMLLGDDGSRSDKWETKSAAQILIGVVSLDFLILDDSSLDDLNIASHSSVTSSHIIVHLTDSSGESNISVLLVHIVGSTSALVSKPDSKVLNLAGRLVEDFSDIKHFTTSLLGLSQ